jgi:hypothetical protein
LSVPVRENSDSWRYDVSSWWVMVDQQRRTLAVLVDLSLLNEDLLAEYQPELKVSILSFFLGRMGGEKDVSMPLCTMVLTHLRVPLQGASSRRGLAA